MFLLIRVSAVWDVDKLDGSRTVRAWGGQRHAGDCGTLVTAGRRQRRPVFLVHVGKWAEVVNINITSFKTFLQG